MSPRPCKRCGRPKDVVSARVCSDCRDELLGQLRADRSTWVDIGEALAELRAAARVLRRDGFDQLAQGVEVAAYRLQHGGVARPAPAVLAGSCSV